MVAAPGAVGKSTLAREIAARTHACYLDLAKAETVAGNYLTGGLVRSGLFHHWQSNKTAVLIDALDEARLRVTQNSFEDFLRDVEASSNGRPVPTVLFGRVGIIEEAWLTLLDQGVECAVFDIDFFDIARSERFVMAVMDRIAIEQRYENLAARLKSYRPVYQDAASALVAEITKSSARDGARFAGYAPVLEAVATDLAAVPNPAGLKTSVREMLSKQVLHHLADNILHREATKVVDQLNSIPSAMRPRLYSPEEQLARLGAVVLGTPAPPIPSGLNPQQTKDYENAIRNQLPQHPFLDGTGQKPSGAVFSAVIDAHALISGTRETKSAAEAHAGHGPHTPNPFLIDFYLAKAIHANDGVAVVHPEHVVVLYESQRARALAGEVVRLVIESDDDEEELDAEIQVVGKGPSERPHQILFKTSQFGELRFARQVNGVFINAPDLDVTIGSGNPVEIVAPVSLNIGRLSIRCPELAVQPGDQATSEGDALVLIEASELRGSELQGVPLVRKGAELAVSWPGATAYPWTHFASIQGDEETGDIDEVLRGIRRLILAFQSHRRDRLARVEDKIEHRRITKGPVGVAIREKMMRDGILTREGGWYFLNPEALGRVAGASYHELKLKRFNDRIRSYALTISA
jgi:hypothetical protein